MKRMIMAFAAALLMGTVTMAQTSDSTKTVRPDRSEMIKKRTEAVAKKYGLNEDQKAKLLELNTKYDGQMRMGMAGRNDRRMTPVRHEAVRKMDVKRDSTQRQTPTAANGNRMVRKGQRMDMRNGMQKYDEELKTIMTEEQFAKYKEDMQKRNDRMGERRSMKVKEAGTAKENKTEKQE